MNTFLPYPSFEASAKVLDQLRLGKQRVECLQLIRAIINGGGWVNHPCTKMWTPYVDCLIQYGRVMCREWVDRGFQDTVDTQLLMYTEPGPIAVPPWLGSPKLHASHRANLIRKDAAFYSKYGWKETARDGYFWPEPDYDWRGVEGAVQILLPGCDRTWATDGVAP